MDRDAFYDIAIIGAGASGLMAAIRAAQQRPDLKIIVIEKNDEPAKKLYATGNGRCNYLNKNAKPSDYYSNEFPGAVPEAAERVFTGDSIPAMIEAFRSFGVEPYEEEEGRLYPRSQQAKSLVRAMLNAAKALGVEMLCGFEIAGLSKGVNFTIEGKNGQFISSRRLLLACGGKAGIQFGCTGDGYKYARAFGHEVIKPIPALTQLVAEEDMSMLHGVRALGRISLLSVQKSPIKEGKGRAPEEALSIEAEDRGEIQFTKEGLSGICTFNVSRFFKLAEGVSYRAELDLLEEFSEEKLREMLLERRLRFLDSRAGDLLLGLLPEKLGDYLVQRAGLSPDAPMRQLSIATAEKIAGLCKSLSFDLSQTKGWKEAQVTAGGVALSQINSQTMESQLVKGLYFAGEILDIDGPCGGYNLSWAFASGYIAGIHAALSL